MLVPSPLETESLLTGFSRASQTGLLCRRPRGTTGQGAGRAEPCFPSCFLRARALRSPFTGRLALW